MADTLLHEIQGESVDGQRDLATVLRKCRILAQRIQNEDLKRWISLELEGYDSREKIPDYRILKSPLIFGHYFGAFGSELKNVQIPHSAVVEKYRDKIIPIHFLGGVRELTEQAAGSEDGTLRISVAREAHAYIKDRQLRDDLVLVQAWKAVSCSTIDGILDTVRNRILGFTLELESLAESTGKPLEKLHSAKAESIQNIFNTTIGGSVGNFAQSSTDFVQQATVAAGNVEQLSRALATIGLEEAATKEITTAVLAERPGANGAFGKRVSGAIGKAVGLAYQGLLSVPGNVAGELISTAVKSYYGLS